MLVIDVPGGEVYTRLLAGEWDLAADLPTACAKKTFLRKSAKVVLVMVFPH